jgi:hypothetical protein
MRTRTYQLRTKNVNICTHIYRTFQFKNTCSKVGMFSCTYVSVKISKQIFFLIHHDIWMSWINLKEISLFRMNRDMRAKYMTIIT